MHAEHADKSELNELSGRVLGCTFTVIYTLGFLKSSMRTLGHRKSVPPACICVFCVHRLPASAL